MKSQAKPNLHLLKKQWNSCRSCRKSINWQKTIISLKTLTWQERAWLQAKGNWFIRTGIYLGLFLQLRIRAREDQQITFHLMQPTETRKINHQFTSVCMKRTRRRIWNSQKCKNRDKKRFSHSVHLSQISISQSKTSIRAEFSPSSRNNWLPNMTSCLKKQKKHKRGRKLRKSISQMPFRTRSRAEGKL